MRLFSLALVSRVREARVRDGTPPCHVVYYDRPLRAPTTHSEESCRCLSPRARLAPGDRRPHRPAAAARRLRRQQQRRAGGRHGDGYSPDDPARADKPTRAERDGQTAGDGAAPADAHAAPAGGPRAGYRPPRSRGGCPPHVICERAAVSLSRARLTPPVPCAPSLRAGPVLPVGARGRG